MIVKSAIQDRTAGATVVDAALKKPSITVFHCFNALTTTAAADSSNYDIKGIRMPCSGMTREVFLLKAFEAGADAVVVLVCPEGECKYMEGNIRASKRVARVKQILDEIGLDGRRLNIYHIKENDQQAVESIIGQTVVELEALGPNPAA
jgi:coenzyme F420-reducing hydrogenase delta subunit